MKSFVRTLMETQTLKVFSNLVLASLPTSMPCIPILVFTSKREGREGHSIRGHCNVAITMVDHMIGYVKFSLHHTSPINKGTPYNN